MDKNAIKKYAVWARRELISRVSQRAALYEITDKGYGDASADSVLGRVMSAEEKRQRQALIEKKKKKGYEQVMEEIAYTWFNRFIALRFMEVNGYLPSHVRVFTDDVNNFKPQILTEAINMELDGLDMERVYALKNANDDDALFKYMLIAQCNALSNILPGMFQRISDYTELLFPDNLLREGSMIEQMVSMIPEQDWNDQVQIIGWLYQYYNTEPKDKVFADLKKNKKISKENIPAATQLFTPDWIVRYMVENSLGRLWLEGHPNDNLRSQWRYYLDEVEQEPNVQAKLAEIRKEYVALKPEDILAIDPCQGSGHILAYMFDVLIQIYEAYGYTAREAASSIVEHNIWGLDLDARAAQLAYFSVMMKARQYDRRFFSRGVQPHVFAIEESNNLDPQCIEYFVDGRSNLKSAMDTLIRELYDAKEYGSILNVTEVDFEALYKRFEEIRNESAPGLYSFYAIEVILPFVQVAQVIAQKYDIVVTNPPYMGNTGMNDKLASFVKTNYTIGKMDLFSVFMIRSEQMLKANGYYGMITQPSWLFLSTFASLRERIISTNMISSVLHMGRGIFGIDFGSTAFCVSKRKVNGYQGHYFRLHKRTFQYIDPNDIEKLYLASASDPNYVFDFSKYTTNDGTEQDNEDREICGHDGVQRLHYYANQEKFTLVPSTPIAYWLSDNIYKTYTFPKIGDVSEPKKGFDTGDNDKYLRLWFEPQIQNICFNAQNSEEAQKYNVKWYPTTKGGPFRRWYGNNEYLVNWKDNGAELKSKKGANIRNERYYFREGLAWSTLSSYKISFRYQPIGSLFECKGNKLFSNDPEESYAILALLNSVVAQYYLTALSPTMDYNIGPLASVPAIIPPDRGKIKAIDELVTENISCSRCDWDSFEVSWDFKKHPLIKGTKTLEDAFALWAQECEERFQTLKKNEEEINRIFIDIYGLKEELTPEVDDRDVTVRQADLTRDVKSLISYAVGCMFGRYSLDVPGLVYAGGDLNYRNYTVFKPDKDGILPICDDEYFDDDIVGRFVEFIRITYGDDALEENLRFIADALGGKGSSRDVIRNYFINDFYKDHLKIYQKRPIYWLFDSGKKNGFKCLIYLHHYQPDTIARIRTDYVHEQQSRYRTAIADLESRIANAGTGERVKLSKQLTKLQEQAEELRVYEEKIHHLADQMIRIDLDNGVKHNYAIFQDVLAKIK